MKSPVLKPNPIKSKLSYTAMMEYRNYLTVGFDPYSGKLAYNNIRKELETFFQCTKFQVTRLDYGMIEIKWLDGATLNDVQILSCKYSTERSDPSRGIYYNELTEFNRQYGGVNTIIYNRCYSDEMINDAIGILADKYESNYVNSNIPTLDDYRSGKMNSMNVPKTVFIVMNEMKKILDML